MEAIGCITRTRIKAHLEVFIENIIEKYRNRTIPILDDPAEYISRESPKAQLKPFHAALIPPEIMRINQFERGLSTSLGTSFEECAKLIALDHHADAQRSYDFDGELSLIAVNEVDNQVANFEHLASEDGPKPTFSEMVDAVLSVSNSGEKVTRKIRADLYVLAKDGTEYFFEMKSPRPNKGQCLEVTQRLLRCHLLRGKNRPEVQAYFAMAYNPYGPNRIHYKWSYALNYTAFDDMILIGNEFWEIIGGPNTYTELLGIYQEVGREKSKYMIDALAFGF